MGSNTQSPDPQTRRIIAALEFRRRHASPTTEHAMKVLACHDIHEDRLVLFRDAGWTVENSEPIKVPSALGGLPGVLSLEPP